MGYIIVLCAVTIPIDLAIKLIKKKKETWTKSRERRFHLRAFARCTQRA